MNRKRNSSELRCTDALMENQSCGWEWKQVKLSWVHMKSKYLKDRKQTFTCHVFTVSYVFLAFG